MILIDGVRKQSQIIPKKMWKGRPSLHFFNSYRICPQKNSTNKKKHDLSSRSKLHENFSQWCKKPNRENLEITFSINYRLKLYRNLENIQLRSMKEVRKNYH